MLNLMLSGLGALASVAVAGLVFGWALAWPTTQSADRLRRPLLVSIVVSALITGALLIAGLGGTGRSGPAPLTALGGAAALARLAALSGLALLLPELLRTPTGGLRRLAAVLTGAVVLITMIAQAPVIDDQRWLVSTLLAGAVLLSAALLTGALVIMVAGLAENDHRRWRQLLPRAGVLGVPALLILLIAAAGRSARSGHLSGGNRWSPAMAAAAVLLALLVVLTVVLWRRCRTLLAQLDEPVSSGQVAVVRPVIMVAMIMAAMIMAITGCLLP